MISPSSAARMSHLIDSSTLRAPPLTSPVHDRHTRHRRMIALLRQAQESGKRFDEKALVIETNSFRKAIIIARTMVGTFHGGVLDLSFKKCHRGLQQSQSSVRTSHNSGNSTTSSMRRR